MRARFFLSCFGIAARFLTGILRDTFVFHSGFWARTGRAGMRTRSLFYIAKSAFLQDVNYKTLQNYAKKCKNLQENLHI